MPSPFVTNILVMVPISGLLGNCLHANNSQDSIIQLALDVDALASEPTQKFLVGDSHDRFVGVHKDQLCAHRYTHLGARSVNFRSTLFVADPTIKAFGLVGCRGCRLGALLGAFRSVTLS